MATLEDRRAILQAEVGRYRRQGWNLIGTADLEARIYKGNERRHLVANEDGTLADEMVIEAAQPKRPMSLDTKAWIIVGSVVGGIVLLLLIVGAFVPHTASDASRWDGADFALVKDRQDLQKALATGDAKGASSARGDIYNNCVYVVPKLKTDGLTGNALSEAQDVKAMCAAAGFK